MATVPSPRTWVAGEVMTAANMNTHVRDAINYLLAPPRCEAYQSVSQNCTTGTVTTLTFTSETVDTDGIHSTSVNTSRMTIVTPGRYKVLGGCGIAANATGSRTLRVAKNAATTKAVRVAANTAGASTIMQIQDEVLCVAGDFIELTMTQDSGVTLATSAAQDSTYLHVVWVGTS